MRNDFTLFNDTANAFKQAGLTKYRYFKAGDLYRGSAAAHIFFDKDEIEEGEKDLEEYGETLGSAVSITNDNVNFCDVSYPSLKIVETYSHIVNFRKDYFIAIGNFYKLFNSDDDFSKPLPKEFIEAIAK